MEDKFVKITSAVYKILDFLPDEDPLKNRAKEKALAILENLTLISDAGGWVSLKAYLSPNREKASVQLLDDIKVLENYLKIGKHQGWIDSINFLIITKEYNNIKSGINLPKGLIKQSIEIAYKVVPTLSGIQDNIKTKEDKKIIDEKKEPNINNKFIDIEKYSERPASAGRQEKILQILAEKEKAQVSDLIKELPNITKRTVRRDLGDLLKKGKIIRVGEWNQVFYKILKSIDKVNENNVNSDRT